MCGFSGEYAKMGNKRTLQLIAAGNKRCNGRRSQDIASQPRYEELCGRRDPRSRLTRGSEQLGGMGEAEEEGKSLKSAGLGSNSHTSRWQPDDTTVL